MVRRPAPVLLCVAVCLLAAHLHSAAPAPQPAKRNAPALSVEESQIRILTEDRKARAALRVLNETGAGFAARVTIELVDPDDAVRVTASADKRLSRGANDLVIPFVLPFDSLKAEERRVFPWYRLRYRVEPIDGSGAPVTGIVSLSEAIVDLFELRVVSQGRTLGGTTYRARVRTANPISQRPVRGVRLEAVLSFDAEPEPLVFRATGETDREGFASLDFELPRGVNETEEGSLTVKARRGPFEQTAESSVKVVRDPHVLLSMDKSLYQPGQTIHLRALAFDATRRAMADQKVTFLVMDDEENKVAFRAEARTSRYGIASVDWKLPANVPLGDYWAKIEMGDGKYSYDYQAAQVFKISRYDLPNFAVKTETDRPYYLKGEDAQVVVRGDYLFGQPVRRGRVRVVRQTERRWNYREQKYEVEEEAPIEGELDEQGRFVARLNLAAAHEELAESDYLRFDDLNFAAYVTDPTTNRTEQRRFRLRITKEPIHVYIIEGRFRQAKGLPLAFYVTTSYADGTPAVCDVSISEAGATSYTLGADGRTHSVTEPDRHLLKVRTNRYGVAKVTGPVIREDDERTNLPLRLTARDEHGRAGFQAEDFRLRDDYGERERTELRVETDKMLYRAGEEVAVTIASNRRRAGIVFDAMVEGRVIASRTLRLDGAGRASFSLPYHEEFQNGVTLSATATEPEDWDDDDYAYGAKVIVFPRNRELKLDVKMTRASYRPGEDAGVEFAVRTPDGRRAAGALGVVVFDKAVEERARTEEESSRAFGFAHSFYSFLYGGQEIAGITQRDIEQVDLSRALPAGFETLAEVGFNSHQQWNYDREVSGGLQFERRQQEVFEAAFKAQLKPVREALDSLYARTAQYPTNVAEVEEMLKAAGVEWGALRDPWGQPYRAAFRIDGRHDIFEVISDGADERPDTGDELTTASFMRQYFLPVGARLDRAVTEHHARTGGFLRDEAALREELRRGNFDVDALRDRWGRPYAFVFDVDGTNYRIRVESSGPNRSFEPADAYNSDDFYIWTSLIDYFADTRQAIERALSAHALQQKGFPRTELELRSALAPHGINPSELRDGWGRPVYVTFDSRAIYADAINIESRGRQESGASEQRTQLKPVTRTILEVRLRSMGPDGRAGTADDFNLGHFTSLLSEMSAQDRAPREQPAVVLSGGAGAISGTVKDPNGAVIAGARVTAKHNLSGLEFTAETDEEGRYLLRNLPSGFYTLAFHGAGFTALEVQNVLVQSSNITNADVMLMTGAVTETVTVSAVAELPHSTNSATVSSLLKGPEITLKPQLSTPRLREFFPETLVWQPSIETDAAGRARLDFKLADNITTWKMSILASTEDGRLGSVEKEFLAFQPFFAEHDPPRVLTEGDEISLPIVLRNYLERPQPVEVEMKPESWFTLGGPARQSALVPAGDAARPTFDFRAVASIEDGRQRVTAVGADASDAIEKPVTVHPDGEERSQMDGAVFSASTALDVRVPAEVIRGSVRSELKLYPNLMAHVMEGVEAIMQRPYGCGEQIVSSSYPSVFVLDFYRRTHGNLEGKLPPTVQRARRYAQLGYERLLGYRASGGGFTYWGRGTPDMALTAYALRFLRDASRVIEVDEALIAETRDWLVQQQREDGSWKATEYDGETDARRRALNTAFVARVLAATTAPASTVKTSAATSPTEKTSAPSASTKTANDKAAAALARALRYLSARAAEIDEPYLIASYALAAWDAGEREMAERAAARLAALARQEGAAVYWSLETNTPFYGWGLAGRVETSALAVQALTRAGGSVVARSAAPVASGQAPSGRAVTATEPAPATLDASSLVERGLIFLLDNKDRYGVWLSTQATVNVLEALLGLADKEAHARRSASGQQGARERAEVFVNGVRSGEVLFPPTGELSAPLVFDLTPHVGAGASRVEIRRAGPTAPAQAQVVTTFYVPWPKHSPAPEQAGPLRLAVSFDRPATAINQEVTCSVVAERVGHQGYGMMLAEVGLPPGADVDRASLERAMQETGWSINSYDVRPDRLVLYLWPSAGGVKFNFKFRPRYGLNAQTAPSQLYDYYNPEARAVLPPTRFVVR
jgi:hypothetical protein